jgi:hypothetical protein
MDRRCFTLISAGVSFVSAILGDGRASCRSGWGAPIGAGLAALSLQTIFLLRLGYLADLGTAASRLPRKNRRAATCVRVLVALRAERNMTLDALFRLPNGESGGPQVLRVLRRRARASLRMRLRQ